MEFENKNELLSFLNAVLFSFRTLEAQGGLPDQKELKGKFPEIAPQTILSAIAGYAGSLKSEDLKERASELSAEIQALRDVFLDPYNHPNSIKKISNEVLTRPLFAGQKEEAVKKGLESFLGRLLRESADDSTLDEGPFPLFTFTSDSQIAPLYDEVAEMFLKEGLVDRAGLPKDDYVIKLENNDFKKRFEESLARIILERHLAEQIDYQIDGFFDDEDLALDTLDLGRKLISEKYAEEIVKKAGLDQEKLKTEAISLNQRVQEDESKIATFFTDLLLANTEFSADERQEIAQKATRSVVSALTLLEPLSTYEVIIDPKSPIFTLVTKDVETKETDSEEFLVSPKEVSDFEDDYEKEKRDFEIIFASQMDKV